MSEQRQTQLALRKEIADRQEAEEQLHKSEQSLRELSGHLLRSQDEERRRIGLDLHDSLGQFLAVLKLKLDSMVSEISTDPTSADQDLAQCIHLADECIKEVRTVAYLLYPPLLEEMGLISAIPWYVEGFSARSGIKTTFEVQTDFGRLPRDHELTLFRVLQECLTNVHRHSRSEVAHIRLARDSENCTLEIEDKGIGIPSNILAESGRDWVGTHGVGLRGMGERLRQLGGRLKLVSNRHGSKVIAICPSMHLSPQMV